MDGQLDTLKQSAALLKSNVNDVPKRIEALYQQLKDLGRENESLQSKLSVIEAGELTSQVVNLGNTKLLAARVQAGNMDALRGLADELKLKLPDVYWYLVQRRRIKLTL